MVQVEGTEFYLKKILEKEMDERITFVVPRTYADVVIGRVRTKMTRVKNRLKARGVEFTKFKIRTEIDRGQADGEHITFWKTFSMTGTRRIDTTELEKILAAISEDKQEELGV